jgi:hypothetical protein
MDATTDSQVLDYQALVSGDLGYGVLDFRQTLTVGDHTATFNCIAATVIWKRTPTGWRESRWHCSVISSDVPNPLRDLTGETRPDPVVSTHSHSRCEHGRCALSGLAGRLMGTVVLGCGPGTEVRHGLAAGGGVLVRASGGERRARRGRRAPSDGEVIGGPNGGAAAAGSLPTR